MKREYLFVIFIRVYLEKLIIIIGDFSFVVGRFRLGLILSY